MIKPSSIQSKLILLIMLVSGVSLFLTAGLLIFADTLYFKEAINHRITVQAEIIAENSTAALAFEDQVAVDEIISSLRADQNILMAYIKNADGQIFSRYQRKNSKTPSSDKTNRNSLISVTKPVILKGEKIGEIIILSDNQELTDQLTHHLQIVTLILSMALFITYLISRGLQKTFTRPITHLANIAREVTHHGSYSLRAKYFSKDELGNLTRDFNSMLDHIQKRDDDLESKMLRRTEELVKLNKKLRFQAYHDSLTRLPNRAMFDEQLSQAIKQAGPGGFRLAVIIIDLDNFKSINDTMGHEAGDDMLYVISDRLLNVVGGSGIVARLGGDEFVILLNHLKNRDIANSLMGEIVDKIKQPISIKGKTISVTMSAGISLYPEHGTDPITLKRTADLAMYQSKEQGRNNYQFFNSSMSARADYRVQIESILRYALDNSDFDILYHPQVTVTEQKIVGAEALIRLPSSKKGVLMPNDFISIAEESRQIIVIDEWVLRQSCIDAQRWAENIPEAVKVAVNISVKTFLYGNLVTMVEKALKDSRLDPKLLELEITENSFIEQNSITMNILNALKKMGVSLAIDDFGTGYSSLSYLKRFPVDILKIDRSFIQDVNEDVDDTAIVKAIAVMAKSLNLQIVAEGVENENQREFIEKTGCQYMQGYLFAKPMAVSEFDKLLIQHFAVESTKQ